MPLSAEQIQQLRKAGFSDSEIVNYEKTMPAGAPGTYPPKRDPEGRAISPEERNRKPLQTPEETTAGKASVARYGIPLAVGALTANPSLIGLSMGIGEMTAQELQESLEKPEFTSWTDYAKRKGAEALDGAGAFGMGYAGQRWLAPLIGRAVARVGQFVGKNLMRLTPKELPPEIQTAQDTLGKLGQTNVRSAAMTKIAGENIKPFSLTLDQLDRERESFISWLGATARSGLGSRGMMKKYDLRNTQKIEEIIDSYYGMISKTSTPAEFGQRLKVLLSGEMKLVEATRKSLYDDFRTLANDQGVMANMERLRQFISENKSREAIQAIYRNLDDILPPLSEPWSGINLADTVEAFHRVNGLAKNLQTTMQLDKRAANNIVMKTKALFEPEMKHAMDKANPAIREAFELANTFYGATADRLENKVMQTILRRLEGHPSGVVEAFLGSKSTRLDNLLAVKEAFTKGAVPGVSSARATSLGTELYEKNILQPLRHAILSEAVDQQSQRFTGYALSHTLDKYSPRGDTTFLKEIFGQNVDRIRELATTLKVIQSTPAGDKVFIQLIQGGQMISMAGALAARSSDVPMLQKIGPAGYVIFLAPMVLAKMLGNPRMTRALTDGIKAGPRTGAFSRLLTILGTQKAATETELTKRSPEAIDFFSTIYNRATGEEEEAEVMQ